MRSFTISSAVWIQRTNVTDRRTDRRILDDRKDHTYGTHHAVRTGYLEKLILCIAFAAASVNTEGTL